ncbi:hypothetical protein ACYPKM_03890 [Pseudomonas aeruginosa]
MLDIKDLLVDLFETKEGSDEPIARFIIDHDKEEVIQDGKSKTLTRVRAPHHSNLVFKHLKAADDKIAELIERIRLSPEDREESISDIEDACFAISRHWRNVSRQAIFLDTQEYNHWPTIKQAIPAEHIPYFGLLERDMKDFWKGVELTGEHPDPELPELFHTDKDGKPIAMFEVKTVDGFNSAGYPCKLLVDTPHLKKAEPLILELCKKGAAIADHAGEVAESNAEIEAALDRAFRMGRQAYKILGQAYYLDTADRNSWPAIKQSYDISPPLIRLAEAELRDILTKLGQKPKRPNQDYAPGM